MTPLVDIDLTTPPLPLLAIGLEPGEVLQVVGEDHKTVETGLVTAALLQKYLLTIGKVAPRRAFISTMKFITFRNVLNLSTLIVQL